MKTNKLLLTLVAVMFALNLGACNKTTPTDTQKPAQKEEEEVKDDGTIRMVSYNVYTFRTSPDIYPYGTYYIIATMMKEVGANVVCLNEIDKNTNRTGKIDQTNRFANAMGGWDYIYGPAMAYDGGEYGEALTTEATAVAKKYVGIPEGTFSGSEPRVLCIMEMQDYIVMTTHLDHVDEATRTMQMGVINDYVEENYGGSDKPVFLGGDLNATHTSATLQKAQEKWDIISVNEGTYPATGPTKCIDIFLAWKNDAKYEVIRSSVLSSFASADPKQTSDHLPILVEVRIKGFDSE